LFANIEIVETLKEHAAQLAEAQQQLATKDVQLAAQATAAQQQLAAKDAEIQLLKNKLFQQSSSVSTQATETAKIDDAGKKAEPAKVAEPAKIADAGKKTEPLRLLSPPRSSNNKTKNFIHSFFPFCSSEV